MYSWLTYQDEPTDWSIGGRDSPILCCNTNRCAILCVGDSVDATKYGWSACRSEPLWCVCAGLRVLPYKKTVAQKFSERSAARSRKLIERGSPNLWGEVEESPSGLGDLGFLKSDTSVPGGCRQRQLWSASHRRFWCTLSRLVRWVNAHSSKQPAPVPAAPGLGEGIWSPVVLRRQAPFRVCGLLASLSSFTRRSGARPGG